MRLKRVLTIACGAALLAAVPAAPAFAGTLQVNPVLLQINAGRRTATVTVRNEEATPVTIRAYALAWSQVDGEDRYEDTAAMVVSPPIFTIPAGGTQLVRVGLRTASGRPQAYRLMIEEIPEANPAGGIRVALRLNLPLYSGVEAGAPGDLRWSARPRPEGGWTVEASNRGTGYVRLDPAAAQAATGLEPGGNINFGTVLPGATRRWQLGADSRILDRSRFDQIAGAGGHVAAQAGSD
ncbi:MAG TPA: fimbria/pilus periplasmic chaperone [Allosphingosinicella sp.]|jgi:fimbrial chaperone protein|nr:fimbria/pilus periplasmic chaperone [Allosphingosinicella sp.]